MGDAWQILGDGGLPLVVPRTGQRRGADELAAATRAVIAEDPAGRQAEALAAFVFAWHHHWPESFARELGVDADAIVSWASRHAGDEGRYLKLRRIALERLSQVL